MQKNRNHSNWWGLILLCVLMLGLFWLEIKAPFSGAGHTYVEVGLIFLLFSLVWRWLNANEHALFMEEMDEYRKRTSRIPSQATQDTTERKGFQREPE